MRIQRYMHTDQQRLEDFGNSEVVYGYHFEWLLAHGKVGMVPLPSTEAECFYNGFMVTDDTLLIFPHEERPSVRRQNKIYTTIGRTDSDEVKRLIELLKGSDVVHAYLSNGSILTFSETEPPGDLYRKSKPMPVEMDQAAVQREMELQELHKMMLKTNKTGQE